MSHTQSQVVGDNSGTAPSKRGTRSRSGCVVCRARKVEPLENAEHVEERVGIDEVKCDERPETCLNCETLSLPCPGYGPGIVYRPPRVDGHDEPHRDLTEAGTKRKRTYRSCKECRNSKTRCSGTRPQCLRCSQKGVDCHYDADPAPAWARTVSSMQQHNPAQGGSTPTIHTSTPSQSMPPPIRREHSISISNKSPQANARTTPQQSLRSPITTDDAASKTPSPSSSDGDEGMNSAHLPWLLSKTLPEEHHVKKLVEVYFANIHPLRCFGFIHKPTYMQRLDEGLSKLQPTENALLHIMCALGAKFYALEYSTMVSPLSSKFILQAGNQWAIKAKKLIFQDLGDITVENLEASILLQDHELRAGSYAAAFMLTATAVRMAQALQLNVEQSTDIMCSSPANSPSASSKETRRRLMWTCFIMDCWVGSGVDQLTLLDERDIKIQLPCQEQNFILQIPSVTETIDGTMLEFLTEDMRPTRAADNMGLLAFFIQLTGLRKRVLRYIKHIDTAQYPPWHPESEFTKLSSSLQKWHENLPSNIQFTPSTMYMRKETSQLGALFLLHCAYHQTMVDLYRIGMPRLLGYRSSISPPPDQYNFFLHCQHTCFEYAKNVAVVIAEAVKHGPGALADSWLWVTTYDSIRIMLYYLTHVARNKPDHGGTSLMKEAIPLFQACLKALKIMIPLFSTAQRSFDSASAMLRKAGFGPQIVEEDGVPEVPTQLNDIDDHSPPGTPAHVEPENVLNPLAIYRLARKAVRERHVTEPAASPLFSMNNVSQSAMHSPIQINNNNPLSPNPPTIDAKAMAPVNTSTFEDTSLRQTPFTPLPSFNPNDHFHTAEVPTFLDSNLEDFEMFSIIDFDGPWQLANAAMMDGGFGT